MCQKERPLMAYQKTLLASASLRLAQPARPEIDIAVARLDAWLDTMRGPDGYGGPVVHWWRQSMLYTGAGLDWRYEGIIGGYLALWERSGERRWLAKARRAGDDLVRGQVQNGNFAASGFEINPATAGTPHEAACDAALLALASALRDIGDPNWEQYAQAAERNVYGFLVAQLWDADANAFRDDPRAATFVPNKAATICDALLLLAELRGDALLVERYVRPTLDRLLEHQVRGQGRLDGAIAQNSFGRRQVEKYIPIYIARCIPALVRCYGWTGDERYLTAAMRAMAFIARWMDEDGTLPTVVYPGGRTTRFPSWIAPLGDVLRAGKLLRPYGFDASLGACERRLLAGQDASGGIRTAHGFAAQTGGRPKDMPDVRDLLHVAGWCDKAFRYLASRAGMVLPQASSLSVERACSFRGAQLWLRETPERLVVQHGERVVYEWRKGAPWASVAARAFWGG
jgi:hypothetical protein